MKRNENWKPSFVDAPVGVYFKDKASEFACYLLEFTGMMQIAKLGLLEVENDNYEMGRIWYHEVKTIIESGYFSEMAVEYCLAKARALLMDETGIKLKEEDIKVEEESADETIAEDADAEEPKRFVIDGKVVDGIGTVGIVVKVTKCFVWIAFNGNVNIPIKRKILRDSKGNEYIKNQKTGYSCKAA